MRKIRILCYIFPSERGCFLTEINIIKWEPFPTKVGSLTAKPNSNPGHLFKQPGVAPRSHDNSNIFYILYMNICLGQYKAEMLYMTVTHIVHAVQILWTIIINGCWPWGKKCPDWQTFSANFCKKVCGLSSIMKEKQ